MNKNNFNQYEELDNLYKIFNESKNLILPSQQLILNKKIMTILTDIYERGYNKGVEIKQELNN